MKSTSLLQTSQYFWNQFHNFDEKSALASGYAGSEILRHRCLLGFTALDATLNFYWHATILPEWAEFLSLVGQALDKSDALNALASKTVTDFNRAQWMASLRFIHNTGEPERFSPSIVDVALALGLNNSSRHNEARFMETICMLLRSQKLRNQCLHTGRDWNDINAFECLRTLKDFSEHAALLHPIFNEVFAAKLAAQKKAA